MTVNSKLPKYIYLYFLCQSINLTAAVISVAVAATVGNIVAEKESLATLPYGMQFLSMLLATYPVSLLMQRKGRKMGFTMGALFLIASGLTGYQAVSSNSFAMLVAAHAFLGIFTACANYYRFAAVDKLDGQIKARAVSLVVAGGLIAGILGPFISSVLREIEGFPLFSMCYGALVVLALLNLALIKFLPEDQSVENEASDLVHKPEIVTTEGLSINLIFAFLAAAVGYGLMNLVMIQSSLQMHQIGMGFKHSAFAIQWHVVAMFAPSFFSGYLIGKYGHNKIIAAGFLLFLTTFMANILAAGYLAIASSLILLGLAWNFTYVGGSAYIASLVDGAGNAKKLQGVGDTLIAVMAMLGAMLPAILMSLIGWVGTNMLGLAIIAGCLFFQLYLSVQGRNALNKEARA